MERIVLEVKSGIAGKWERASLRLKKQATQAIEQLLDRPEPEAVDFDPADKTLSKAQRRQRIEALTSPLLIDLSGFKFDRDEANDYER